MHLSINEGTAQIYRQGCKLVIAELSKNKKKLEEMTDLGLDLSDIEERMTLAQEALRLVSYHDGSVQGDHVAEAATAPKDEEPELPLGQGDRSALRDLLSLVEVEVTQDQVMAWSAEEAAAVEAWAAAVHLRASDNNDVEVPERPTCLPPAPAAAAQEEPKLEDCNPEIVAEMGGEEASQDEEIRGMCLSLLDAGHDVVEVAEEASDAQLLELYGWALKNIPEAEGREPGLFFHTTVAGSKVACCANERGVFYNCGPRPLPTDSPTLTPKRFVATLRDVLNIARPSTENTCPECFTELEEGECPSCGWVAPAPEVPEPTDEELAALEADAEAADAEARAVEQAEPPADSEEDVKRRVHEGAVQSIAKDPEYMRKSCARVEMDCDGVAIVVEAPPVDTIKLWSDRTRLEVAEWLLEPAKHPRPTAMMTYISKAPVAPAKKRGGRKATATAD